jgi:hypothetical protein
LDNKTYEDMTGGKVKSFRELEYECESLFLCQGSIWHLYTPGDSTNLLFRTKEDFIAGMNIMAFSALDYPQLRHFTFELMNNHLHAVVAGEKEVILEFFNNFKKRLSRYLLSQERYIDVLTIKPTLKQITDLMSLRNLILYVNRNGYVVNSKVTPFSYPWGANMYFFNPVTRNQNRQYFSDLKVMDRRRICRSHKCDYPDSIYLTDGYISPLCYCDIDTAESFFRNAHHYMSMITKGIESYSEIAKGLGDRTFLSDDEMYTTVTSLTLRKYKKLGINELSNQERVEMANTLHFDYNASNKQISRILKLDLYSVESMFPKAK